MPKKHKTNFTPDKIISSSKLGDRLVIRWKDGNKIRIKTLKWGKRVHRTLMRTGKVPITNTEFILKGNRIINWVKRDEKLLAKQIIKYKVKKQESLTIDTTTLGVLRTLRVIVKLLKGEQVLIRVGATYYTLSDKNINKLLEYIRQIEMGETTLEHIGESDEEIIYNMQLTNYIEIVRNSNPLFLKDNDKGNKVLAKTPGAAFFKYLNKTDLDLDKYGVFKNVEKANYNDNCMYLALKAGGLEEEKLQQLKTMILNRTIPQSKLKYVAETFGIYIKIKRKETRHKNDICYGNPNHKLFYIGLIDEHYFIIDKVPITYFALKNYWELIDHFELDEFRKVFRKEGNNLKKKNNREIDSFKVIDYMFNNKNEYLSVISWSDDIFDTQFYDKIDFWKTLSYDYREFINKEKNEMCCIQENKMKDRQTIMSRMTEEDAQEWYEQVSKNDWVDKIFFDFETYIDEREMIGAGNKKTIVQLHIPYLCRYVDNKGNKREFFGEKCGKKMLESLKENTLLIAHNAGYDLRFIAQYLYDFEPITKGTGLIYCRGDFYNNTIIDDEGKAKVLKIHIKDSLKLIPMPLKKFGSCFNLPIQKEIMPYDIYNKNSINERFYLIKDAIKNSKYIKNKKDIKVFKKNIKKWNLSPDDEYFDIIEYSNKYCEIDCDVLRAGYEKFRGWLKEEPIAIDIDTQDYPILTIASLAAFYLLKDGCFKDVYKLSGVPREFIMRCMVGGRTMCRDNVKWNVKNCKLADYDGVSLYPSACERLGKEYGGFLKGRPKVLKYNTLNMDFLNNQSGYFVKIKVLEVGKKLHFPLMSYINDDGVRVFTNAMEGKFMFVDKTTLEDLIKFQKIEFSLIQGYYYDEGRNNQIQKTIRKLFNLRLQKKKEKNPIQIVYKLIMNASYGKCLLKCIETNDRVINGKDNLWKFVQKNYNLIKEITPLFGTQKFIVKTIESIKNHFNNCPAGVEILSMSKRIMNEVMVLAEDLGLTIYYQDTDSMHIEYDDVKILKEKFKEKYGRELDGKDLGQFHIDFDLKDEDGNECKNIYSNHFIALGKKCYIDKLVGEKEDGSLCSGVHKRMKGVPSSTLSFTAKKSGMDLVEMYEYLYKGQDDLGNLSLDFDLLEDGERVNFKFNKDYTIVSMDHFVRTISFGKKNDIIKC